ncbi:S1 family peptidase [Gordonia sp. 'Campus']|uniref:S1 family peptidase n=1 Tax=Gordonia sp. 'Campus' TaxID=2915824 RepID=UPI001EE49B59|nr:S1 family peptidase [Gordonia sp. 'Campus']
MNKPTIAAATTLLAALALAVGASPAAAITPAYAHSLTAGQGIVIGDGLCSIGFFGTNADGDRLAVTAGHCAEGVGDEVTTTDGEPIGEVVDWKDDGGTADGSITLADPRGYTVIAVDDDWEVDPVFAAASDPEVGDPVTKTGERTGTTVGTVTALLHQDAAPEHRLVNAELVVLGGDSGSPWYLETRSGQYVLVGISSSGNFGTQNPDQAISTAQTIEGLYEQIADSGSEWTDGFEIWVVEADPR